MHCQLLSLPRHTLENGPLRPGFSDINSPPAVAFKRDHFRVVDPLAYLDWSAGLCDINRRDKAVPTYVAFCLTNRRQRRVGSEEEGVARR